MAATAPCHHIACHRRASRHLDADTARVTITIASRQVHTRIVRSGRGALRKGGRMETHWQGQVEIAAPVDRVYA